MAEKRKKAKTTLDPLKAPGDHGTIARLRQSCRDAAGILEHMAAALNEDPFTLAQRRKFAKELRRGAGLLRGIVFVNRPRRG